MEIDFYKIRSLAKGQTESFEELSCQLFYRKFVDEYLNYERYRGDGGDGGVEAIFFSSDNKKIAIQSKFWENNRFDSSQINQLTKSIDTAMNNHPEIKKYFIAIPFNLTGKVANGKKGKSQTEKFEEWKNKYEQKYSIEIKLLSRSILADLLLQYDMNGGLRTYWFNSKILTEDQYKNHIEDATVQVGKRYTPKLSIKLPISKSFNSFIYNDNLIQESEIFKKKYSDILSSSSFRSISEKYLKTIDYEVSQVLPLIEKLVESSHEEFQAIHDEFKKNLDAILGVIESAENFCFKDLKEKFGEDFFDTPGFRQFHAEYMCEFPAADLDITRELIKLINDIIVWLDDKNTTLYFRKNLLIHGVAGIGKTHSILDYLNDNGRVGLWVFFGEDFNEREPWQIIAEKIGIPSLSSKEELFEILSVQSESENKNCIIFIDALNESKNRKNWNKWLPVLVNQISKYQKLKICVSCRDAYLNDVFTSKEDWVEIEHNGFPR